VVAISGNVIYGCEKISLLRVVIPSNLCRREDARQPRHQELSYQLVEIQTRLGLTECQWLLPIIPRTRLSVRHKPQLQHLNKWRFYQSHFSQPPLKAYRRAKNLRDLLVHSDFPPDQPAQQPGAFPCKRNICRTCPHINRSTSIPSPGGQIQITGHFTSTSDNVFYCISCRKLISWDNLHRGDRTQGTPPRRLTQEKWLACSLTLKWPRPFTRRRPCRRAEIGPSGINRDLILISIGSRDTHARALFSHAQTVSKQHTAANNYLVILRGRLNTLKKAVMSKRRLIYTVIKRLARTF